ncbi:Flp pilus assembly protein CpaB [Vibrio panuliri]|uniref:Flp pilus assembly protein CpaB n=1 Tax=Vibrio panuliri TaxID=1381081 RepID=A0A1Q9HB42_9VIBR|nr:Flp pilus assembly protein CpaB [Vibrio panuliri]OLQ86344.1 Flp pilus assembly protein CpaB [Vibrio panuliri]
MRSKIILLVAVIAIAGGLFGVFFSNTEPSVADMPQEVAAEKAVYYKSFVLAKERVSKGQVIHNSDFKIVKLSESEANAVGLDDDEVFEYAPGSIYMHDMQQGQTVYFRDIVQPSDSEYVNLIIDKNHVPFPIKVSPTSIVGGVINPGSNVDILALTGDGKADNEFGATRKENISISPVLVNVKVLKVEVKQVESPYSNNMLDESYLILELNRKQVAILTIAQTISTIEVHKSVGNYPLTELQANAGDVLPDFKAIKELRANKVAVK